MDSFEINKILGALLFTCLVLLALNIGANALFAPVPPAKPGFEVAVQEKQPEGGASPEKAAPPEPIEKLLASADPKKGEASAKKCLACHTLTKGGPNKIGPNLYGVVNRPKGSEAGFSYSDGMKKKGGNWTIDDLNQFLANPRTFVPGTKMTFVGLPKDSERADVIAYLNSLSDNPAPLPKAAENAGGSKTQ
jgi:cytochrome c